MRVRSFGEEPEARSGHSAVVIGKERMMVFGGCDVKRGVCFSDTFVLDLRRLKWERVEGGEEVLGVREEAAVGRVAGKVYVFGGEEEKEGERRGLVVMNVSLGCEGVDCGGHGVCRNGVCMCQEGYFGEECEVRMKCRRNCLDRGICMSNGRCRCFAGFEGEICEMFIPCPSNCSGEEQGLC